MKRNELIEQIKTVLIETGINPRKWTRLAKELNDRSILTKGGRPWALVNLKNFCERYILIEDSLTPEIQLSDTGSIEKPIIIEGEKSSDVGVDTLVLQQSDSKKGQMTRNVLIEQIKTVLIETGINPHKWTKLANELNNRSILTKGGKPWAIMNLKNFCERYILIEDSITPEIQMTDTGSIEKPIIIEGEKSSDVGVDTLVIQEYARFPSDSITTDIQVDDSKLSGQQPTDVLHQMKSNMDVTQTSDTFTDEEIRVLKQLVEERLGAKKLLMRVEFDRTETCQKTVRISVGLFEDAKKREKNFSKLVEVLLWEYMGRDPKYLAKTQ